MTAFETTTCARCGGSGHYSCNAMHGTTCYGCGGSGKTLSKRGKAAQKMFHTAIKRPANTVQEGWLVWWGDLTLGKGKWVTVASVREFAGPVVNGVPSKAIEFMSMSGNKASLSPSNHMIRAVESLAQRDAAVKAAIAYQDTLNPATGRPPLRTKPTTAA
jgi:hypothetical protein